MADMQKIGSWAFLLGVVISVIAGLVAALSGIASGTTAIIAFVLVILGILVGLLNIKDKEITNFLVAAIALIVGGTAAFAAIDNIIPTLGTLIDTIVNFIAVFVTPAAIIVALKAVWSLGKAM